jgi:hypothetical protein
MNNTSHNCPPSLSSLLSLKVRCSVQNLEKIGAKWSCCMSQIRTLIDTLLYCQQQVTCLVSFSLASLHRHLSWIWRLLNAYQQLPAQRAVPIQAWTGPLGSKRLRFPELL